MGEIRVAVVGIGNCASALLQGIHYYRNVEREGYDVPGLLHTDFGGYKVKDVRIVAAFDIDKRKVGKDLGEAIYSEPNNTRIFCKVPEIGVKVTKGRVLDSVGKFTEAVIPIDRDGEPTDVVGVLRGARAEMVLNYLPVGSEEATQWYAQQSLEAGCAFIDCIPTFIASTPQWQAKFEEAGLPVAGDDVMSQIGATVLHKTIAKLLVDRGVLIEESYQLNIGGDMDFLNMLEEERLRSKRISKTSAVQSMVPYEVPLRIGPSDYVDFLHNKKICYIWLKGRYFGDSPVSIDLKLDVVDAPNSAGIVIDVIRAAKLALERGVSGPLTSISAYAFKHPPIQAPYEVAKQWVEEFIEGKRER